MSLATARDTVGKLYYNLLYRLEASPITARVGGASARFDVSASESDYFHVRMCAHERPILRDLLGALRPDDVFWDVGAKIGLYSWLVADALAGGEVVAFEPTPSRGQRWRDNHTVNPGARATLHTVALAAESGEAVMSEGNVTADGDGEFTARLVRGDALIADGAAPAPDVVKIDTEGYELQVLRGLRETLRERPPRRLYIETHDKMARFGESVDAIHDLLAGHGYERARIESEYPHGNTAHWKYWRP